MTNRFSPLSPKDYLAFLRASSPGRLLAVSSFLLAYFPATAAQESSCLQCHGDFDSIQDSNSVRIVRAFQTSDVHRTVGLSCHDCHGGNPDPKLADDMPSAMDQNYNLNPYRGAPKRTDIPGLCGRCHSDPNYMKPFKPGARVDQLEEYWTSQHGKLLKAGDTKVATCIDCHGTHAIRSPSDAQSSVYRTAVADTCRKCHSDPKRMGQYRLADGSPLPTDQYDRWRRSVHARAMFEKDDLSAPTCNDCHGNHGAAPPNLASILSVCGQCHGREAGLFRISPKEAGFKQHNETFLPDMGKGGCAECHDPPEPSASIKGIHQFSECITCHGNHSVISPTVAMLGPLLETPCAYCHEGIEPAVAGFGEPQRTVRHYQQVKAQLLAKAEAKHLQADARFDWLVDQALQLPFHHATSVTNLRRPQQFLGLFQKFRIGKTYFTYSDSATGREVQQKITRCADCHGPKSNGFLVSSQMSAWMHDLAVETARAERTVLAAQRGGLEVRKVRLQLDQAVDAEIQLEVLLHTFSAKTNGPFAEQHFVGVKVAGEALRVGLGALGELRYRHLGLLVSLGIILCVVLGLGLKIRDLSRRDRNQ
jgi:hypothetical protein